MIKELEPSHLCKTDSITGQASDDIQNETANASVGTDRRWEGYRRTIENHMIVKDYLTKAIEETGAHRTLHHL